MDELLTPVSTTYLRGRRDEPLLTEVASKKRISQITKPSQITSLDDALDVLRNQPDYDALAFVLKYLTTDGECHLHTPGPKSAAVIHVLVSEIASNYWTLLREGSAHEDGTNDPSQISDSSLFVKCLQSVAGLNATLSHLKALAKEQDIGGDNPKRSDISLHLALYLDLLSSILKGDDAIRSIWRASTGSLTAPIMRKTQSQLLLSLVTSGKILSIAAETMSLIDRESSPAEAGWISDGTKFVRWVGDNIVSWAMLHPEDIERQFCSDMFQRGMSLGYLDTFVSTFIDGLLMNKGGDPDSFVQVCLHHPQSAKKTLNILLQNLSQRLNGLDYHDSSSKEMVSAAAGIIDRVTQKDEALRTHLINWCATSSGAGLGDSIGIRRAVLAVLAEDKESISTVFERSLSQFGDQLYIRHAAILQQNIHVEILLLAAGYVSKLSPIKLRIIVRSGSYMTSISNRIAATQARSRFLGMVVGEALSSLMDDKHQKLDFHMEETETDEAQWLKSLTKLSDEVGPIEPILNSIPSPPATQKRAVSSKKPTPKRRPKLKPEPKITASKPKAIIEEINSSDEDEDLVPYAKGSDPEDSDDDATLVQRNKPKPPVYIRDLILFLRDSESYDKQKLGIQTAPILIRRKATFGTEVSSHAQELAGLLVGLQDKFDIEDFGDLKLQSMIALIVAQPKSMAPWFSRTFFEGDYSLSQRTQILVAVGLSARELAGFDTSEYQVAASFPSKRLPEKIEQLYLDSPRQNDPKSSSQQLKALPSNALDTITKSLTSSFLAPLAAEAADSNTGPDALKLETFTARYKSKSKSKPRVRAIPNTTAALIADSFFYPLTAHFQFALRSAKPLILNPALLSLYLQTLGIVIHSAGPSTLSLPQLTSELWDLLLAVRVHAQDDIGALKGWFVAMASMLEVNDGDMRRLCESQGREVVETREWVSGIFAKTRGEDGGSENEVKMLAAGVLIKLGEAIEKYQALLMGDMIGGF